MDHDRFATVTRTLRQVPSRRDILHGLVGIGFGLGGPRLEASAKHKHNKKHKKKRPQIPSPPSSPPAATCTPRCRRRVCGDDGCGGSCGSCPTGQFCRSGTCCTPEPAEVTCAGRCGTVPDNICHLPATCTCPGNQQCLSNGSCAIVCGDHPDCIAVRCNCDASVEGPKHCNTAAVCEFYTQVCSSTAECPVLHHCRPTNCGPGGSNENRCVPLCTS